MALHCEHCGKDDVDEDDQVCHSCGVVSEGLRFDDTCNPFCSDTKTMLHLYNKKKNPKGLEYGITILNNLSSQYSVSAEIKENTIDLLKEAYSTKKRFNSHFDVGVLAGCCLLHCMKRNMICVSISGLFKKLNCTRKKGNYFYNFLKEHLKKSPIESTKPKVEEFTFEEKLDAGTRAFMESVTVKNKEELIKKTIALTKLASSCWLTDGRSLHNVIHACGYICWKSMNHDRQPTSHERFCEDYSITYSKGGLRITEVRNLLVKLGQEIIKPVDVKVTKQNVHLYLNNILENSESLRNDLLQNEFTSDEIDKKEFSTFRKPVKKCKQTRNLPEREKEIDYKDDMNASDIEISDTEIASYIRSEEQIKVIMSLTKKGT